MAVKILVSEQEKVVADVIPVGMITLIGDESDIYTGADWLECDGSEVSRTTYADLFAVIGTTFGPGDGTTTFNLPNANPTIISGAQTFSQFIAETVITVANTSPINVDISAGAAMDGIRITIIHQSNQELTITTGEDMTCVIPGKGMIVLVWDDDAEQWCLTGGNIKIRVTITSNGTWKTPFGAVYKLSPVGGGGGGGSAEAEESYSAYGGGGAGGGCQQLSKYEPAGTTLTITIGSGGGSNTNGNDTTITDGTITLYGMGGGAGSSAYAGSSNVYASGGVPRYPSSAITAAMEIGMPGQKAAGSYSGKGGNGAYGAGNGGAGLGGGNGNNGSNYGGGGSGGAAGSSSSYSGGSGATGVVFIEY